MDDFATLIDNLPEEEAIRFVNQIYDQIKQSQKYINVNLETTKRLRGL